MKVKVEKTVSEWRGSRRSMGNSFHRQGAAYWKEWLVIWTEDRVGGRARVTTDEERVLWQGWTEIKLWKYWGWFVYSSSCCCSNVKRNILTEYVRHDKLGLQLSISTCRISVSGSDMRRKENSLSATTWAITCRHRATLWCESALRLSAKWNCHVWGSITRAAGI